jgi:rsbT co-antagonist protein RsbR
MATDSIAALSDVLHKEEATLVQSWVDNQMNASTYRSDRTSRQELLDQSRRFMALMRDAVASGSPDVMAASWNGVRQMLDEMSVARARQGFSPSETAMFIFSLKQPLFDRLQRSSDGDAMNRIWSANLLLDRLGLYTTEVFQRGREQVIIRQQQELMELSTPVVTLWEGILALPLIGTLDSARTQVVMESLLQRIVETGAAIAIIDITGVPTVDTVTAQHLLKTVAAADGRRLHHQRDSPADRADNRASRRRARLGGHQGDTRRCVRDRSEAGGPGRAEIDGVAAAARRRRR